MTRATEGRATRRSPSVAAARLAVVAVILVAALTACFPAPPAPRATPSGLAHPASLTPIAPLTVPSVLAFCPVEKAVHDDGYALAVDEVYICRGDVSHGTDGVSTYGPWEAAYRIEHPADLLKAYRHPDARADATPCGIPHSDPLIVWVHHDGVTTAYYAPVDACGAPSRAATTAYQIARRTLVVEFDRGAPPSQKDVNG